MSTLRLAWRNLGRNYRRTALALAAIGLAQMTVVFMSAFVNGQMDLILDTVTGPLMGHAQVHAPGYREERAPDLVITNLEERLEAIRALPAVESALPRLYAPALAARERDGHAVMVLGLDPAAETRPGGILDGMPADELPEGRQALIGAALAREIGVEVGDELAIVGQGADGSIANDLVTVRGLLRSSVELVHRQGLIVPLATAQEAFAMEDQAHEITVRGRDAELAEGLSDSITALPVMEGVEVLPWKQLAPELVSILELSSSYSLVLLFIVFIAAAAGIANTMLMATFERRRELGMLLSLGSTPGRLISMVLLEALLLGLLGVGVGSLFGGGLALLAGHYGIDMTKGGQVEAAYEGITFTSRIFPRLKPADMAQGVLGVSLVSVLAALWPAIYTARLEPVKAMRS